MYAHMHTVMNEPFSFAAITASPLPELPASSELIGADGVRIKYFAYEASEPRASMLFIHGGGAHSGAGYQAVAQELPESFGISVYLMDLRGHGISSGKRGDAGKAEYVYEDVHSLIQIISKRSGAPLFLAGHSSGIGLILNLLTYRKEPLIRGIVCIAPEFGYKSNTARNPHKNPFASIRKPVFIVTALSGKRLCNKCRAIDFHYPERILQADPLLLTSITASMAYALTPEDPAKQFGVVSVPTSIIIGSDDELIDPEKLSRFIELLDPAVRGESSFSVVPGATHLSIVSRCASIVASTTDRWCKEVGH